MWLSTHLWETYLFSRLLKPRWGARDARGNAPGTPASALQLPEGAAARKPLLDGRSRPSPGFSSWGAAAVAGRGVRVAWTPRVAAAGLLPSWAGRCSKALSPLARLVGLIMKRLGSVQRKMPCVFVTEVKEEPSAKREHQVRRSAGQAGRLAWAPPRGAGSVRTRRGWLGALDLPCRPGASVGFAG